MNLYEQEAKKLKDKKCKACDGTGEQNDAGLGDMYYNTWTCSYCNGSGVADVN